MSTIRRFLLFGLDAGQAEGLVAGGSLTLAWVLWPGSRLVAGEAEFIHADLAQLGPQLVLVPSVVWLY